MSRRKDNSHYNVTIDGFWVSCSVDTKQKIEDFFTCSHGYDVNANPIIIGGRRVFSLYTFTRADALPLMMLMISRSGVSLINKFCSNCGSVEDVYSILQKIIVRYLYNENSEAYHGITNLLPLLARHYFNYRDKPHLYNPEEMQHRYFCLMYPLNRDLSIGLNMILNQIIFAKEDTIIKDRIYISG